MLVLGNNVILLITPFIDRPLHIFVATAFKKFNTILWIGKWLHCILISREIPDSQSTITQQVFDWYLIF